MKKDILLIAFSLWLLVSCSIISDKSPTYKETFIYMPEGKDLLSIEKDMAGHLYKFYFDNKNNGYEFYEVESGRLLLNYSQKTKTLNYANDMCSGWVAQYRNVDEVLLKKVANSNLIFSDYDTLLERQDNYKNWLSIRSNGCNQSLNMK